MKLIPLTQELFAQVDDEDFDNLNQYKWYAHKDGRTFYARRAVKINKKVVTHNMHNHIMNGKFVDHIDNNGLNNQKINLRFFKDGQNNQNKIKKAHTTSKYIGVSWHKGNKRWEVKIRIQGKNTYLGGFSLEKEAAECYDAKAKEIYGEFAKTNFKL